MGKGDETSKEVMNVKKKKRERKREKVVQLSVLPVMCAAARTREFEVNVTEVKKEPHRVIETGFLDESYDGNILPSQGPPKIKDLPR